MSKDLNLGYPTWFSLSSQAVKIVIPFTRGDRQSSFMPLLDLGRHKTSLTTEDLDLRQQPEFANRWHSYIQTTSCQVRFNLICSLRASTLPKILNRLGTHWQGHSLWAIKQSLVTLPMESLIPPSMKTIMGMMTSPSFLWVSYSLGEQYRKETPRGM